MEGAKLSPVDDPYGSMGATGGASTSPAEAPVPDASVVSIQQSPVAEQRPEEAPKEDPGPFSTLQSFLLTAGQVGGGLVSVGALVTVIVAQSRLELIALVFGGSLTVFAATTCLLSYKYRKLGGLAHQVNRFQAENKVYAEQNAQLKGSITRLEEANRGLQELVATHKAEVERLGRSNREYEGLNTEHRARLSQLEAELQKIESTRAALKEQTDAMEKQLAASQEEGRKREALLKAQQQKNEELGGNLQLFQEQLQERERQLRESEELKAQLDAQYKDLERTVCVLREAVGGQRQLVRRAEEIQHDQEMLIADQQRLQEERRRLQAEEVRMQEDRRALLHKQEDIASTVEEMLRDMREIDAARKEAEKTVGDLAEENEGLRKEGSSPGSMSAPMPSALERGSRRGSFVPAVRERRRASSASQIGRSMTIARVSSLNVDGPPTPLAEQSAHEPKKQSHQLCFFRRNCDPKVREIFRKWEARGADLRRAGSVDGAAALS